MMICQLMVQRESKTTSLITAYEQSIVSIMKTHGLNVVDDFAVMAINFLRILRFFLFIRVTAERKRVFVCIDSYGKRITSCV